MKKLFYFLYFVLLAAELFVGSLLMISLCMSTLYIPCIVAAVAMLGMLIWQIILLVRAADPTLKKKIMCNIAFVMAIPIATFIAVYIFVAAAFVIAFM